MRTERWAGVVLALGSGIVLLGVVLPESLFSTEAWLGLGAIYLAAGVLNGLVQLTSGGDRDPFSVAILVAVLSAFIPVSIRANDVLNARPELALADATFVLWQFEVLVPVVVAFMTPAGVATTNGEKSLAAVLLVAPILAASARLLATPSGFGALPVIPYHIVLLFLGGVVGLPLYLFGRTVSKPRVQGSGSHR